MADYAQSPYAGIDYYKAVVARMEPADGFLRLYVTPGAMVERIANTNLAAIVASLGPVPPT
jgi:hypothetical protein